MRHRPQDDRPTGRPARPAVTLIELLVVIIIIGLLVGLLMGGLGMANEHAYDVHCKSNLHQLATFLGLDEEGALPMPDGWVGYVRDHGGLECLRCPKDGAWDEGREVPPAGVTGTVREISPPRSVVFGAMESNSVVHMYIERENTRLPRNVPVDITEPGTYSGNYGSSAGTITAGTSVTCYFLFFDPEGSNNATTSGRVTFGGEIIGIICQTGTLDQTDTTLGAFGTAYPTGQSSRGFEGGAEVVALSADRHTFEIINFQSSFPGENVRVLTVPDRSTGNASYAMNALVPEMNVPPGQVLLLEFNRTIAQVDDHLSDDAFYELLAPRHFGRVNVLFADGSVQSMEPEELTPVDHPDLWMY